MELIVKRLLLLNREDRQKMKSGDIVTVTLSDGSTVDIGYSDAKKQQADSMNGNGTGHDKKGQYIDRLKQLLAGGKVMKAGEITHALGHFVPLQYKTLLEKCHPYTRNGRQCHHYRLKEDKAA